MGIFSNLFQKTKKAIRDVKERVEKLQQVQPEVELPPAPAPKAERVIFELSAGSVVKSTIVIILLIGLTQFVMQIGDILVVFFVSFLLAAAMEPAVDFLNRRKIPRGLAVIIFYILFFALLGVVISSLLPLLARQISELATRVGGLLQNLSHVPADQLYFGDTINKWLSEFFSSINIQDITHQLETNLQGFAQQLFALGGNLWEVIKVVSNGLIHTFLVLILAFFMTVEKDSIDRFILSLFPLRHAEYVTTRIFAMKKKIGHWLRAMLIMMISIGVSIYIGLVILGVEYAAVLAILAGLLEVLPVLGPPLALLFALPIVANQSAWLVLWVVILYLFVQQIEGHILVPIVMKKVTGLSAIVVLFALLVGARFLGILGIVLAVPVATMLAIFFEDYLGRRAKASSK